MVYVIIDIENVLVLLKCIIERTYHYTKLFIALYDIMLKRFTGRVPGTVIDLMEQG